MGSQKKLLFKCIKLSFLIFFLISPLYFTIGCEKKEEKKTSSVDFTVVTESDMPCYHGGADWIAALSCGDISERY